MSDETNTYGDDIHLTTTDATTIYNTLIAALEKGAGEPLYPGDERRIFGEGLVAVFVALYNSLDDTGRQTLLRYARGEVLDAIGERLDVHRLEGSPAKTTMRFSVSTPQPNNIIIPKWTKVTPDSDHYFATDEIAVLQAGAYSVEIPTSAVSNGTEYNGYAPGTITTLVDLIPYIESVTNIAATAGGDDGEPYTEEGDNRLRERIRLAPASRSTAGPEQAYIYWAMTADSSIIDARAVSETETISRTLTVYDGHAFIGGGRLLPDTLIVKEHGESTAGVEDTDYTVDYTDDLLTIELKGALADATSLDITITRTLEGCVKIVPLLEGGAVPDESILEKVLEACNASDIRPLTDVVTAGARGHHLRHRDRLLHHPRDRGRGRRQCGRHRRRHRPLQRVAGGRAGPGHQPRPAPQADPLPVVGRKPDRRLPCGRDQAGLHTRQRHTGRQVQRAPDCQP